MKHAFRQILVCALALICFCVLCRLSVFRTYTAHIPCPAWAERPGEDAPRVEDVQREEARTAAFTLHDGYVSVPIRADSPGEVEIRVYGPDGSSMTRQWFRISPLGTVYDPQTAGFTGDTAVLIAVTLFWIAVSVIMLTHYFRTKGPAYYAYATIYFAGFSLFSLATGLLMLRVTVAHLLDPVNYSMLYAYRMIDDASIQFMMLTLPAMVVFAIAMAVSNIALLRHEKPRPQNALGLAVSVLLIVGEAVGMYLFTRDYSGSEWEVRIQSTLQNVYATAFVYFECMLVGSVICGVKAGTNQPAPDKDFIIILGCWFRRDGTLPPLLRGRVDRAVAFWRRQKELNGKTAVLIPSGGQGANESMAEAEAIRRYLLAQNIPEDLIRVEDRAANTFQNMSFSKAIIDEMQPDGKIVFATTNYHVFRSGLWASLAGLPAEGIGGKTKWWFWPNAFMRECAGLLAHRWKQEAALLALLMAFFGLLSMIL